jgi:Flp pilus assembly secretin CpaC
MTAKIDRTGPWSVARRAPAGLLAALLLVLAQPAAAADVFKVVLDRASIMKLPDGTSTVVVGNPLIADVSIQAGGLAVVTGKGYGATNLVALDRAGATLMERELQVRGGGDSTVFVYRGVERESYACAPTCERRITLGDSPAFFAATATQTDARNSQASGAAKPPGAK